MYRKKKLLALLLALTILLCSCGGQPSRQPSQPETPEEAPYDFTLDYHRCAPMVEKRVGSSLVEAARLVVDAFLAGETSVTLPEGDYGVNPGNDLGYALSSMCPVFGAVTDYDDGGFDKDTHTVAWAYTRTPEQVRDALAALEQTTAAYMSTLRQGDGETARALLLYHALTEQAAYDYEMERGGGDPTEYQFRTSSYAALVLHSGICHSFAQALAFLYTQAGLDCAAVMGDSVISGLHMWLMAAIDGKWYYFDPTWDVGGSWYYFGITAEDRAAWAGEFPCGTLLGQDAALFADLSDQRFSTINCRWWADMTIDRQAEQAVFVDAEGEKTVLPLN